ncbi:MAG: rRNA maturation RNase YbeY [Limisphaerales bacterium]
MSVTIANRQRVQKINRRLLKQIANALLTELEIKKAEIGICLVAAPEMTRLNETFLRHAGSTDVITFDYRDSVLPASCRQIKLEFPAGCRKHVHGEIFVCVDEAVLQARKFGTIWQSEVIRYLIHGVLHLLGFDDSSPDVRRKMKREENRRLREMSRRFPLSKLSCGLKLGAWNRKASLPAGAPVF